jgi:hypothetical protein
LTTILHVLGLVLLDLVLLVGLFAIPLGLSGNFIILGAAVVTALVTGFQAVGWLALAVMAAAVTMGEVVEAFLGTLMARRYGASAWGMSGAFLGGWGGAVAGGALGAAAGTLVAPVIGTLVGSFLGTAVGAILMEWLRGNRTRGGIRAGWGALLGKILSSSLKLAIGLGMAVYLVLRTH